MSGDLELAKRALGSPLGPELRPHCFNPHALISLVRRSVMRWRRHFAFSCKLGKKSFNLLGPNVARMRHVAIAAMPADEKTDPIQLSFFSIQAIVIERTRSLT